MGWTTDVTEVHPDKYIICLAPHTSNWDFLIGQLYNGAQGIASHERQQNANFCIRQAMWISIGE